MFVGPCRGLTWCRQTLWAMVSAPMHPDINLEHRMKELSLKKGYNYCSQLNTSEGRGLEGSRGLGATQEDLVWASVLTTSMQRKCWGRTHKH